MLLVSILIIAIGLGGSGYVAFKVTSEVSKPTALSAPVSKPTKSKAAEQTQATPTQATPTSTQVEATPSTNERSSANATTPKSSAGTYVPNQLPARFKAVGYLTAQQDAAAVTGHCDLILGTPVINTGSVSGTLRVEQTVTTDQPGYGPFAKTGYLTLPGYGSGSYTDTVYVTGSTAGPSMNVFVTLRLINPDGSLVNEGSVSAYCS